MTTVTSSSPSLYAATAPIVTTINSIGIEDALKAVRLQPNVKVNITDSVANIKKYLGALNGIVNNVVTITESPLPSTPETFSLTASQYTAYSRVLAKLESGLATASWRIALSGVTAAAAISYSALPRIQTVSVTDTSANIGSNIAGLKGVLDLTKLGTITQSGTTTPISLTRSVYEANSAVLGKIGAAYKVALTGVTAAQAVDYARTSEPTSPATRLSIASLTINARIGSMAIVDSTGGIESKLDELQKLGVRLKTIVVDDSSVTTDTTVANNGKIDLTAEKVKSNALVLGKITNAYQLAVHSASLAQASSLSANKKVVAIDIVDRGANIVKSLPMLNKLGTQVTSVTVTDSENPLALSDQQLVSYDTLLGRFAGSYTVDIAGSSMLNAKLLLQSGSYRGAVASHINSISISDTAANIASYIDGLDIAANSPKISKVKVLDLNTPIVLTAAQLALDQGQYEDSILSKISGGYSLKITDVAADDAHLFSGSSGFNSHITSITVTDDAQSITENLAALTALGGKLESIVQTDRMSRVDFDLAYGAWTTHKATLEKVVGNYGATLSSVTSGAAASVAADGHIESFSVADNGAEIQKNFDALVGVGSKLTAWSQSDTASLKTAVNGNGSSLTVSAQQFSSGEVFLDKFTGPATGTTSYALAVTGMTVSQVLAITSGDQVVSTTVLDTSANIAANIDGLKAKVTSNLVSSITQQGTASTLEINATQLASDTNVLAALTGNYSLSVSGVAVGAASALLGANSHVTSVSVSGSKTDVANNLSNLKDLGKKLTGIVASNSITSAAVTSTANIAANYFAVNGQNIGAVSGGASASAVVANLVTAINLKTSLTGVTAAVDSTNDSRYTLATADGRPIAITSSASGYSSSVSGFEIGTSRVSFDLSADDYANYRLTLDKLASNYTVNLTGVNVDQVATFAADTRVGAMAISDTAERVSGKFDSLRNFVPKIQSINGGAATGSATALTITASQYALGTALLAKVNYAGTTVKGATTVEAQNLSDSKVTSVTVSDTSAKIAENLDALQSNAKVTSITQSGTIAPLSITRAQLTNDAGALAKITGNYSLSVSGVAAATSGGVDGAKDLLLHNSKVSSISVSATAAEIATNLGDLAKLGSKLVGLVQSDPLTAINITDASLVANRAVLDKINGYRVNVSAVSAARAMALADDARVVSLDINATGTEVSTYFDALKTVLPKIVGINKPSNETAPVTGLALSASQYAQGGALLAKIGDYTATLKGVSATYAATLFGQTVVNSVTVPRDAHVLSVAVVDTSANIVANLVNLNSNSTLSGIILEDVTAPLNVTYAQRTAAATVLGSAASPQSAQGLIAGNWKMNVTGVPVTGVLVSGVPVDDTAMITSYNGAAHITSFSVNSSAASVVASLSALAGSAKLSSISLTVAGSTLSMSEASLLSNISTLQKIDNGYSLSVSAATIANLPDLAELGNVSAMQIADTSKNISDHFDDLVDLGATLTALQVSNSSTPLALTYADWAAGTDTLSKITGGYTVDLLDVGASNVVTLSALAVVDEIFVKDSSSNIANNWADLANKAKLVSITLSDNGAIRLTEAQQALAGSDALKLKIQGTHTFVTID